MIPIWWVALVALGAQAIIVGVIVAGYYASRGIVGVVRGVRMKILSDYVIWSIEHEAWWKAAKAGYTESLSEAGIYSYEQAEAIVKQANIAHFHECMIPIAKIVGRPTIDRARN